jgi:hypothetical protein
MKNGMKTKNNMYDIKINAYKFLNAEHMFS